MGKRGHAECCGVDWGLGGGVIIEIDLLEVVRGGMNWIVVAQVAGCFESGGEHSGLMKCGDFLTRTC